MSAVKITANNPTIIFGMLYDISWICNQVCRLLINSMNIFLYHLSPLSIEHWTFGDFQWQYHILPHQFKFSLHYQLPISTKQQTFLSAFFSHFFFWLNMQYHRQNCKPNWYVCVWMAVQNRVDLNVSCMYYYYWSSVPNTKYGLNVFVCAVID